MNFEATTQLLREIYPEAKNILGVFKLRLEKAKSYKSLKPEEAQKREKELAHLNWVLTTAAEAITLANQTRGAEFARGLQRGKELNQPKLRHHWGHQNKEAHRAAHNNQVIIDNPQLY
jgi:hypothetical protein